MKHLIFCREFPPAPYPPGGIGVYVQHISRLLAEHGETVHVIGQRWGGAAQRTEVECEGRLIVHRISPEDFDLYPAGLGADAATIGEAMRRSPFPAQWFSWVAAGLAEALVESEGIDVIEAQEWEAPLYYFALRRSLGLGPTATPPCIIHFHSPTEFIFRHNEWPLVRPDYWPMQRMEDFTILAADAHLCPSGFLAGQCTRRYSIAGGVEVIPLPQGTTRRRERSAETWSSGSILFSGRLEPRKGVIELVDAAIAVARSNPALRFDFVGSDNEYNVHISMLELLEPRIPPELKACFRFHGSKSREELLDLLATARIGVTPSRWENFPNTCLEQLGSGIPVVATRNGGMAEMIEDGVTGWLADDGDAPLADRIEAALRRALATPAQDLARMGAAAASAIEAMCDNGSVTQRHVDFRRAVAERGAIASLRFPRAYPWPHRVERPAPLPASQPAASASLTVAVIAPGPADPTPAIASLEGQVRAEDLVVVARAPCSLPPGARFVEFTGSSTAAAKALALEHGPSGGAVLVLDAHHRLMPGAVAHLATCLDHCPEAGLVAGWTVRQDGTLDLRPEQPAFPHQWLHDGASGPILYRAVAIDAAGGFPLETARGHEDWELATRIMAAGWQAIRAPLAAAQEEESLALERASASQACHVRSRIAARAPALAAADVDDLLLLHGTDGPSAAWDQPADRGDIRTLPQVQTLAQVWDLPLRQKLALARHALKERKAARQWLLWRLRTLFERAQQSDGR